VIDSIDMRDGDLATGRISRRLLLVAFPNSVATAFEHALAPFGYEVEIFDSQLLDASECALLAAMLAQPAPLHLPLLVGTFHTWQLLRSANFWVSLEPFAATTGRGVDREGRRALMPPVRPPVVLNCSGSLTWHDVVSGLGLRDPAVLRQILRLARPMTSGERELLATAARRAHLPAARHRLLRDGNASQHVAADRLAAVRFLQGAFLAGDVGQPHAIDAMRRLLAAWPRNLANTDDDTGLETAADVLKSAGVLVGIDPIAGSQSDALAAASAELGPDVSSDLPQVGNIVLVDDEQSWHEAFIAVWPSHGIRVVSLRHPNELVGVPDARTLVNIVDLSFPGERFGGIGFLRSPASAANQPPLVFSSVHDFHSVMQLLQRRGAFAYISKKRAADDEGMRDELSFFLEFRDTVVLAAFASLAGQVRTIWRSLVVSVSEMGDQRDGAVLKFADGAADALISLSENTLHAIWHAPAGSHGLATREAIRRLGLLHDVWCSVIVSSAFDPDEQTGWPGQWLHLLWPIGAYHQVNTVLRGEASHAQVDSVHFSWLDCWIIALTQILRAHALPGFREDPRRGDLIADLTRTLWGLLRVSGFLSSAPPASYSGVAARLAPLQDELRELINAWRTEHGARIGRSVATNAEILYPHPFGAGCLDRVAVAPYATRGVAGQAPLIFEFDVACVLDAADAVSHLLVLEMVAERVRSAFQGGVNRL
jgi:hypothetical protein